MRNKNKTQDPSAGPALTDAERTKANILEVASEEFAIKGLSGARVDEIADKTRTSKRMIYYYFGGKEGLYRAVLEKMYGDMRSVEAHLDLNVMSPMEALKRLVEQTFDYDESHPNHIRLVSVENIHQARHLSKLKSITETNASAIAMLTSILERGRAEGVFRSDIAALDLHLMISAFCFFRVSNRYTFGTIFGRDLTEAKLRNRHKKLIVETIERLVRASPG
jgi:AcrR family transcriptional regulator